MSPFPATVPELLQELQRLYPEPTPRPGDSHDKIIYDAGARSVVLGLLKWRDQAIPPILREIRGQGRVRGKGT